MDPRLTAETMCRRAEAARLRREVEAARLSAAVRAIARVHLQGGGRAWLIGSLAWGGFGPHSDVDLVVDDVPPGILVELEREIAHAAGAPVDVLRLADLPSDFRERIERDGVRLA